MQKQTTRAGGPDSRWGRVQVVALPQADNQPVEIPVVDPQDQYRIIVLDVAALPEEGPHLVEILKDGLLPGCIFHIQVRLHVTVDAARDLHITQDSDDDFYTFHLESEGAGSVIWARFRWDGTNWTLLGEYNHTTSTVEYHVEPEVQAAIEDAVTAAATGLLDDKGDLNCSGNPNYPAANKGDIYRVSVAGKIGGGSGVTVSAGDWVRAISNNAGGTQASVGTGWSVAEGNIPGVTAAGLSMVQAANAAAQFSLIKQDATDAVTGVVMLATDWDTITGTDTVRAVTPAGLSARLASPGPFGAYTPNTGRFTQLQLFSGYADYTLQASHGSPQTFTFRDPTYVGGDLNNYVTPGGSDNVIPDIGTSVGYAYYGSDTVDIYSVAGKYYVDSELGNIRTAIYQLARSVKIIQDTMRAWGMLT